MGAGDPSWHDLPRVVVRAGASRRRQQCTSMNLLEDGYNARQEVERSRRRLKMGSVLLARCRIVVVAAVTVLTFVTVVSTAAADGAAPGAPGAQAVWTPANKQGFGTSTTTSSRVWYTLGNGELTEVYYPTLGTPSVRDLQLIVSDGKTFAELETDATTHRVQLVGSHSLTYRPIDT